MADAPALDILPMDLFGDEPFQIDLVYAHANHPNNIFGVALYHESARLSLNKDLARIVIAAARTIYQKHGYKLVLKDGLRPVEAQFAMGQTKIVQDNPHWLQEPGRLISPPSAGGHPRGMAVDVSLMDKNGHAIDMGTCFDEMTPQSARGYRDFSQSILDHRELLEDAFVTEAARLNLPLLPLPSEWWDFRFPRDHYQHYPALSEKDLPPPLQMIAPQHNNTHIEWHARFDKTAKEVLNSL